MKTLEGAVVATIVIVLLWTIAAYILSGRERRPVITNQEYLYCMEKASVTDSDCENCEKYLTARYGEMP